MAGRSELDFREWRFETCEERLALSVQPVADFWYDTTVTQTNDSGPPLLELAANDLANLRAQYGLSGVGQTVAVIDSGIAYDHVALGRGLGPNYRVVGGWDFAENDANPYDDGPAGFHGTHVAGILGADDSRYPGSAPGVDLVSLRVFNDQGGGYFSWVEQALSWVHEHRDSFESPITTVNLSLGTEWNSTALPKWATLEDELKQLADDGLFVTVAAGNSFLTYGTAGLSYPAASPYVTAVASVDASGNLSRFSQRASGVLAAPGERVTSTVPDAFYGSDGIKNDWGAASGTSMAAPQVAGDGVLLREAMQNLGYQQTSGTAIRELLQQTADGGVDPLTGVTFYRVNMGRALETLVGPDEFGDTAAAATSVGSLSSSLLVSGTMGSASDRDFFQFTATRSGTATLRLSDSQAAATWIGTPGAGISGRDLTLSVAAGQTYTVGVAASGTISKYTVQMDVSGAAQNITAVDWGAIDQRQVTGVALAGSEVWYEVTATRAGKFSVEAMFAAKRGSLMLEICDQQQTPVAFGSATSSGARVDAEVAVGQKLLIHIVGVNNRVDFRLTNLVSVVGGVATVAGTEANDTYTYSAATGVLTVNETVYSLAGVSQVHLSGGAGSDKLIVAGGSGVDTVALTPGSVQFTGGVVRVAGENFESIEFTGGHTDQVTLIDSAGNDLFEATPQWARMSGRGYTNWVTGATNVIGVSQAGGSDSSRLFDSEGDDRLTAGPSVVALDGPGFRLEARGFAQSLILARSGGYDSAWLQDSRGSDELDASSRFVWLRGTGYSVRLEGFDSIVVSATAGGGDVARLWGGTGNDVLTVWNYQRNFYSAGVAIQLSSFKQVAFDGGGGYDTVDYATAGRNARLYGRAAYGSIVDQAFETQFADAEAVTARVRSVHKLKTDLAGIEFYFQRLGRK